MSFPWIIAISVATGPLADDPPVTREAVCRRVATPPTIDGELDDAAWKAAEKDEFRHFPTWWKKQDNGDTTRVRLAWDDDALYFAATMTDKELKAFGTKRNDHLFKGDVFEIFFKPSKDESAYYELEFNPKAVIMELPIPARPFDFDAIAKLPPSGIVAAAKVDGTLDQPGDVDRGWRVEGKVPWSFFAPTGGRPKEGDAWTFAACRYDYGPEGTEPLLMSSAPLEQPNFHRYEDYGRLVFEGEGPK